MARGIDRPFEKVQEPPVDIIKRYDQALKDKRCAAAELSSIEARGLRNSTEGVLAKEQLRLAEHLVRHWAKKAAIFNLGIEARVLHIVAMLAVDEAARNSPSNT